MNKIKRQVSKARQRLMLGRFMRILCWSVFGGLICSTIGLAIPKLIHIPFVATPENEGVWIWSWVVAGAVVGFLIAAIVTWRRMESQLDTAVEVDRRFGLKERLSSAMSLSP